MNQENFFKGQDKVEKEANKINDDVDAHYARPRIKKDRPADEVAHEVVKDGIDTLKKISEENKLWYENMRNAGIRILDGGFLEISRWDNTGKNFGKPKIMKQKVDGINSAIRMQDHILGLYRSEDENKKNEYSKVESMQEVIEYANDLLNRWGMVKPEDKKEMQQKLADVVLQLEKCKNEFKLEVKDQAEEVIKLKDKLDRENPSALAARTVASLNNLAKRMNELQLISPLIALRKEVLILEKRRSEGIIRKAEGLLSGVVHHSLFSLNSKTAPEARINDYEIDVLDRKLGQVLNILESIYVAPYFQKAEQVKFFILNKIKKNFRTKKTLIENLDFVRDGINEMQNILRSDVGHFG